MKRIIEKIRSSSSATKLLVLIVLLLVVVMFASSSFYIQYKNDKNSKLAKAAKLTDNSLDTKVALSNVEGATEPSSNSEPKTPSRQARSEQPESIKNSSAECRVEILSYSTTRKEVSWLNKGETKTEQGKSGYNKICNQQIVARRQPVAEIVYVGTKPLTETILPLQSVVKEATGALDGLLKL